MSISNTTPVFAVDEKNLVPGRDHLIAMADIPPSRMFLINKSLKVYVEKNPGAKIFDASQGDGGASPRIATGDGAAGAPSTGVSPQIRSQFLCWNCAVVRSW